MDAFDSDVLIYAAVPGHPLGERVAALFPAGAIDGSGPKVGVGSVLLLSEVLSKPLRDDDEEAVRTLSRFLVRLDLRPVDNSKDSARSSRRSTSPTRPPCRPRIRPGRSSLPG